MKPDIDRDKTIRIVFEDMKPLTGQPQVLLIMERTG